MGAGWETVKARAARAWEKAMAHKVVSGIVTTAVTGAAVAGWNLVIDKGREVASRNDAVVDVTVVRLLPELGFVVGFPEGTPPAEDWERTEDGDFGPVQWARDHGGAELGVLRRRIVLDAVDDTTVVTGLRAEIVARHDPLPVVVDASAFGVFEDVAVAGIDLDRLEPLAVEYSPLEEEPFGAPFFAGRTLNLEAGKPATIDVWVVTETCQCDFELVLDLVADGDQRQQVIRDVAGRAFSIGVREGNGAYEPSLCPAAGSDIDGLVWNGVGPSPGPECVPFGRE